MTGGSRPKILICGDFDVRPDGRQFSFVYSAYPQAIRRAGGVPLLVPASADPREAEAALAVGDGLLLVGGDDINPARYGQTAHPKTSCTHANREAWDFTMFESAEKMRLPILGICLGCQLINVARGGSLHQHIPDVPAFTATHSGKWPYRARHRVDLAAGKLREIIGTDSLETNSSHHQGVDRVGRDLRVAGVSEDGLVEAIEGTEADRFLVAVQWHPEDLPDEPRHAAIFAAFVNACRGRNV